MTDGPEPFATAPVGPWPPSPEARAAALMGRHWARRGHAARAKELFEEALALEPIEIAYEGLVQIHLDDADPDRARACAEAGLRSFSDNVRLHKAVLEDERSRRGFDGTLDLLGMKQLSPAPVRPQPGEVLACAVVRNELLRLPRFLEELRRVGVDQILVVDNGSTDGSVEFLRQQSGVHLWQTTRDYRPAGFGIAWAQALLREFAVGHWVLLLDADEMLCYPGYEDVGVAEFCRRLDAHGLRAASGLFIDMYSDRTVQDTVYRTGDAFLDHCPYFDRVPFTDAEPDRGPFHNATLYTGGVRERVFGGHYWLTKTPLIRYDADVILTTGQHFTSHPSDSIAHDSCAVLHFKHFSSFDDYARAEIVRKQHALDAAQYRDYLRSVDAEGAVTLYDAEQSVRLESSTTLVELGLVKPI